MINLRSGKSKIYFNPRPHAGGDLPDVDLRTGFLDISIHAPTRGATITSG